MGEVKNDFTKGSIPRAILSMAIPMAAAQMMNVLYNLVDRVFIGHIAGVGTLALTGLGVALPVASILMAFANLAGMGGGPLCAIERGKGNNEEAERYMGNSFALLLIFGAVLWAVTFAVRRPLLYLFGASDATFPYAEAYLTIYLIGTVFVMIELGMNSFINAQGFGKMGMLTVSLGAGVNLVLDPIFIFALGMGVQGAALATVIAQGCSAVWVMKFLLGDRAILKLRREYVVIEAKRTGRILSLGLAGFVMSFTNSVVQIVCNSTAYRYGGDLYVGAITIIYSVREIILMIVRGLTGGSEPVIGYNYGAGRSDRVCGGIRFMTALSVGYAVLAWALVEAFPHPIIALFTSDPALTAATAPSMRIYYMGFLLMALQFSGQSTFVSLGKARFAVTFSLLRKVIIVVPLTLLLPLAMGVNGIFAAEPLSDLFGGGACFLTMLFTVYLPTRRLARQQAASLDGAKKKE